MLTLVSFLTEIDFAYSRSKTINACYSWQQTNNKPFEDLVFELLITKIWSSEAHVNID